MPGAGNYAGASPTSCPASCWFETEHLLERRRVLSASATTLPSAKRSKADLALRRRRARDKFDLLRFDASGAVSSGMFDEDWPRYVLKMATGAGKTKVLSLLIAWSFFHKLYEQDSTLSRNFLVIAPNIIVLDRLRRTSTASESSSTIPFCPTTGTTAATGATTSR